MTKFLFFIDGAIHLIIVLKATSMQKIKIRQEEEFPSSSVQ